MEEDVENAGTPEIEEGEGMPLEIECLEAGSSGVNLNEEFNMQLGTGEVINKYLSGEIPFDNYDLLLDEEQSADFDSEDTTTKPTRVTKKIPPHIKSLIGKGNLRFARGDHETAKKICFEIIRQQSSISEPYITLAQIFEPTDPAKSLDYYMIATFCNPRDVNLWTRCAQLSLDANKVLQAIFCYTNAVRVDPSNIKLHLKRIQLLRQQNDSKNMLRSYVRMMQCLTPPYYEFLLQVAVRVASEYHQLKDYKKAIDALNIPFLKCPNLITPQMLKSFKLLDDLLKPLLVMEDEVEIIGDLFLDVVEALMAVERYEDALKLLVPLIKSNNYSLAAVWLKYADCQSACSMYEQAIESYKIVMRMAPLHVEVKYNLAEVYIKLDKKNEALQILHQDPLKEEINIRLLMLKIKLLKELEEYEEYWQSVELLISRHCETIRHFEEIRAVTYLERPYEKLARLKKLRKFRDETLDDKPTFVCSVEPTVEEEYEVFCEAVTLCNKMKKFALMQKFVFTALTSVRFKNKYDELGLMGFFAAFFNKDSFHAYPLVRELVIHHPRNHLAWNLFNVLLQRADDLRHIRFMMRFLSGYSQQSHLRLLEANCCLAVGNIKIGLGYYLSKLRSNPTPLTCMLLGCILLYIFSQKFTQNKEKVTKTTIALFLKYSTMRSKDAYQEIYYNLGRMYQQFGIVHLAKHYYELVLNYKSPLLEKYPNLSLTREAAYNLHIIYKNAKNYTAAKNVLIKHLRI
ncbi:hypothetical protein RN001_013719 [Aquatica leii]|uniref:General transcription factor 3C polypeptide 3 n=1 Tax=Aquatica leii TaxID=1421715 RepID=A0AAN7P0G9_9COLE|nr:hypothetical protein RN001_013719 [Aquatica leii]